jgi:hypothetical protein
MIFENGTGFHIPHPRKNTQTTHNSGSTWLAREAAGAVQKEGGVSARWLMLPLQVLLPGSYGVEGAGRLQKQRPTASTKDASRKQAPDLRSQQRDFRFAPGRSPPFSPACLDTATIVSGAASHALDHVRAGGAENKTNLEIPPDRERAMCLTQKRCGVRFLARWPVPWRRPLVSDRLESKSKLKTVTRDF